MNIRASLSLRLSVYVLTTLFLGTMAAWLFPTGYNWATEDKTFDFNALAEKPIRRMVAESIASSSGGGLRIEPSATLRAQMARTPTVRYAVFDSTTGMTLPGSSTELAAAPLSALSALSRTKPIAADVNFRLAGEASAKNSGWLTLEDTPFGQLLIAVYGYQFEWQDVPLFFRELIQVMLTWNTPVYALVALVVSFSIWQALASLRRTAADARLIDINRLNQRLTTHDIPAEVLPLVNAFNAALARLDDGVAKERRFNVNAAHELRTPIALMLARLGNPRDEAWRPELRRHLTHLQNIVDQLLESARLHGKTLRRDETLDLAALVVGKIADLGPLVIESGRDIEYDGPSSAVMIFGERFALESVVGNLINNALRAEPKDGTIIVRLTREATLEVVDHGAGVEEADRELIFEPFWRKSEATPGTGLGLAIVKEIVEFHNGRVWVEKTPGGGATFKVSFRQERVT